MRDNSLFLNALKKVHIEVLHNIELKPYTSLHIGGKARYFYEPSNIKEIQMLIKCANAYDIAYCIVGNGSNILVHDEGYDGLMIVMPTKFHQIEVHDTQIIAQAGASLKDACEAAYEHGLAGMEFAYGIPATCGGSAYMNAGAYGGEIKDILVSCEYIDEEGELQCICNEDMHFRYRHSIFTDRSLCVVSVVFQLQHGNPLEIRTQMDTLMEKRKSRQPLEYPSAGSTFKRPMGSYASLLIAECGLKGYQCGDAQVSQKHAGFLINLGNATSYDFLALIEHVRDIVYEQTGILLECEVRIL